LTIERGWMRVVLLSAVLLSLAPGARGQKDLQKDFVGTVVPPFPAGWKEIEGACIRHPARADICAASFAVVETPGGILMYLGKNLAPPQAPNARWQVTDAIGGLRLPPNHYISATLCEQNGKADETIVAIVKNSNNDAEWHDQVHQAYRMNLVAGQFEKIPAKGIRCQNPAAGL